MVSSRMAVAFTAAALAATMCFLGACGPVSEPAADLVEEPAVATAAPVTLVTEDGLPGEAYAELTSDGAWSWFGGPRAVFDAGEHRRTYVGFVTSTGDVTLAHYDHDSGDIVSAVPKEQLQQDDNASPAVLVRPDHRLMVFYSGNRGRWMVYRLSARAEDITEWGSEHAASGHTSDFAGYTYPSVILLTGEGDRRYVFWRGVDYLPMFAFSETGMSWSEPDTLVRCDGERPFVRMASDGASTIHFALTPDHPTKGPANGVYYVRYEDGEFRRADGSRIGTMDDLPLEFDDLDLVYDAVDSGAPAWVWDVAFDTGGNPVIAYAVFPDVADHRYRYARWNGAVWTDTEIAHGGSRFPTVAKGRKHYDPYHSGGVALDHSDPSVAYLSRPVSGVFEIERWTTSDGGGSWNSEAVTSGSVYNNVRPVVPLRHEPGGPRLIWMNGDYIDSTEYSTSLRMK